MVYINICTYNIQYTRTIHLHYTVTMYIRRHETYAQHTNCMWHLQLYEEHIYVKVKIFEVSYRRNSDFLLV